MRSSWQVVLRPLGEAYLQRDHRLSGLAVTLAVVLRLTQKPVQGELHQSIRVIPSDTTTPAYGSLTYLMSGVRA
jgi:hypothetical protein